MIHTDPTPRNDTLRDLVVAVLGLLALAAAGLAGSRAGFAESLAETVADFGVIVLVEVGLLAVFAVAVSVGSAAWASRTRGGVQ